MIRASILAALVLLLGTVVYCDERLKYLYHAKPMIDYFLNNPITKFERKCYSDNIRPGDSIDFVIDLAASPSLDQIDTMCANSPIGLFLEQMKPNHNPTRSYFDMIAVFIDVVTYDMKPERTHTVIYENGNKYYLRGRAINETIDLHKMYGGSDFSDSVRNLKTMFPVSTKSLPDTHIAQILVNDLGRMTKLVLRNRDNGVPTVMHAHRRSKPVYTIVLTDGASGASIEDLTDDLSRTTVIDFGNHRFVERLNWDQVRLMPSVLTLTAPQTLMAVSDSVRNMACLLATHHRRE